MKGTLKSFTKKTPIVVHMALRSTQDTLVTVSVCRGVGQTAAN